MKGRKTCEDKPVRRVNLAAIQAAASALVRFQRGYAQSQIHLEIISQGKLLTTSKLFASRQLSRRSKAATKCTVISYESSRHTKNIKKKIEMISL